MGVDTKGVLLTSTKDVMVISSVIENALNRVISEAKKKAFPNARFHDEAVAKEFKTVSVRLSPRSGMVNFSFSCFGEQRDLHVFFECDCDHVDLAPSSVSMSLGCWGNSELFVTTVLQALSPFGAVWFDRNDCDDVDMAPLGFPRLSLLNLVALDFLSAYQLESLVEKHLAGLLCPDADFATFVGMPRKDFESLAADEDYEKRWETLEALAKQAPPLPTPVKVLELA